MVHLPRIFRRLPEQLANVALDLHALDPGPAAAALHGAGFEPSGDGARSRLEAISAAGTRSEGFERLRVWFEQHAPQQPALVVCHGDLHPFNLLIDADGTTTVLDWTNSDLMPREFDVGFTAGFLRCAPISVPKPLQPVITRLTNWLASAFVKRYEKRASLDTATLIWFEALQYARCLAEVATARSGLTHVVGAGHPFEISAVAMTRRLAALTSITVTLPTRQPAPAT